MSEDWDMKIGCRLGQFPYSEVKQLVFIHKMTKNSDYQHNVSHASTNNLELQYFSNTQLKMSNLTYMQTSSLFIIIDLNRNLFPLSI